MSKILDGKIVRDEIVSQLKEKIAKLNMVPTLAIIQIGNLKESTNYIHQKKLFAEKIGAVVQHYTFPESISEIEIINEIKNLNQDANVEGIILQLPLPKHLDSNVLLELINSEKDVDGLTFHTKFTPATARGVLNLLDYYKIDLKNKKVAVMGQSRLVGRPIAAAISSRGAVVTAIDSHSKNPKDTTKLADIVIVAIGKPKLIDRSYLSKDQIVIDVGITVQDGKLLGDVDFDAVKDIVSAISPVPGGVGPLTVASLFENLVEATRNMV